MTKWKKPPKIKVLEALGTLADGRVHLNGNTAKVYSSSGNKFYEVKYDAANQAITANDNGSYWRHYLGYPAIAYLLAAGIIEFNPKIAALLKGLAWKDINTKFKNDWDKTEEYIKEKLSPDEKGALDAEVDRIYEAVNMLDLNQLGKTAKPPKGY